MASPTIEDIAGLYTRRHARRGGIFGDKPYANYGYWTREGMAIEEACEALTDLVVRAAGIGPGDRVLEVGCGYGGGTIYYTRRYEPASVIAIDITEVRLQRARELVAQNGLADRVRVRFGDATAMDFAEGSFTKILAVECAFHFNTRRDFFREASRVLTPGGMLALTDYVPRRGVDREQYLREVYPVGSSPDLNVAANTYDADAYAGYLREAGFTVVQLDAITDKTIQCYTEHLERLSRQSEGEKATLLADIAQKYRDHLKAGLDYILVAARKD